MIRAVIDPSILVRALIKPQGTVGPVLEGLRNAAYQLLYSDPLVTELADVLARPRLRAKYGLTPEDVATVLSLILLRGEPVVPARRIDVCRDPTANMVLEAGIAGQADAIVSGDKDLLTLDPFEGIPILSPAAFLRMLYSQNRKQGDIKESVGFFLHPS
ncbi:MAG TPA: putative toxin-antitoxin system toxin component, PIN family [Anaerolineales bacterium]|nr:putative toxin-antitoxin system toxin component, PIN family [Anaerolineales bacterium]